MIYKWLVRSQLIKVKKVKILVLVLEKFLQLLILQYFPPTCLSNTTKHYKYTLFIMIKVSVMNKLKIYFLG
jgi:hypothetical protein